MDNNILAYYMQKRLDNEEKSQQREHSTTRTGRPFFTISRQYGCPSREIAAELQTRLDAITGPQKKWNIVNKEIIQNSAKELDINPQKLRYVFEAQRRTAIDEVIASMSTRYYKSDRRIRKTIREVIEDIAAGGYSVIIGRGGVAITNDFPNSLHIRLFAPQEWRLKSIMKRYNFRSQKEAFNHLRYVDKKRTDLIDHFSGGKFNFNKFDVQINCETFSPPEIAEIVTSAAKTKKMV
ncbi:MAG: cytidylate kinase-like family protein [Bacteroidales bacterium]|nr:cytidylate kinase-like family protein [Bacteroidales bacterium]MCF8333692.1 cytidylate kinase-like family protein [Bacteroidales bacterium]